MITLNREDQKASGVGRSDVVREVDYNSMTDEELDAELARTAPAAAPVEVDYNSMTDEELDAELARTAPVEVDYNSMTDEELDAELARTDPAVERPGFWAARVEEVTGIKNAALNALDNSRQALMAGNGLDANDAAEIARLERAKDSRPVSKGYADYQKAQGWNAVKAFATNPIEVLSSIIAEGLAGSAPALASGLTAGVAGAATAGAAGSVVPGIGNVIGAGGGFTAGMVAGTGAGSFATEYGGKILEELQKSGMDIRNPESIAQFFADEQNMAGVKEKAVKRGVPVAVFDAASAGIAGRIGSIVRAAAKTPTRLALTEAVTQGALGGGGEIAGSLAAGDPISGKAVFGEVVGELGPGLVEVASGRMASGGEALGGGRSALGPNAESPEPSTQWLENLPPVPVQDEIRAWLEQQRGEQALGVGRSAVGNSPEPSTQSLAPDGSAADGVKRGPTGEILQDQGGGKFILTPENTRGDGQALGVGPTALDPNAQSPAPSTQIPETRLPNSSFAAIDAEIPLGLRRNPVVDSTLADLPDADFEARRSSVTKQLDELEKQFDEVEFSKEQIQQLAALQDDYDAVENEAYRREVSGADAEFMMEQLRRLNPDHAGDRVRVMTVLAEADRQGIRKELSSAIQSNIDNDPDRAEIWTGILQKINAVGADYDQTNRTAVERSGEIKGGGDTEHSGSRATPQREEGRSSPRSSQEVEAELDQLAGRMSAAPQPNVSRAEALAQSIEQERRKEKDGPYVAPINKQELRELAKTKPATAHALMKRLLKREREEAEARQQNPAQPVTPTDKK